MHKLIADIGFDAIRNAERFYFDASGGLSVQFSCESYIQAKIFELLSKTGKFSKITLEEETSALLRHVGLDPKSFDKSFRDGRVDIVIWSEQNKTLYPIEIKAPKQKSSLNEDAERLRRIANKCSRPSSGFIFGYCLRPTSDKASNHLKKVADECRCQGHHVMEPQKTRRRDSKDAYFGAACYRISGLPNT